MLFCASPKGGVLSVVNPSWQMIDGAIDKWYYGMYGMTCNIQVT